MNKQELRQAIKDDTKRSNYPDADFDRYITQGEALIYSKLRSYGMQTTLTEADRVDGAVYSLPDRISYERSFICNSTKLTKTEESNILLYADSDDVLWYCMRPTTVAFAKIPDTDTEILLLYIGMPDILAADTDTNTLLTDFPQLYIEAASFYVYRRARDYESAQTCLTSLDGLITDIDRKVKKMLGGAQAANGYNTAFRSSY